METQEQETLGTALPKEMARVRDEVLPVYQSLPRESAWFVLSVARMALDEAARTMAEGDVVGMIAAYKALQDIRLD